MSLLQALKLPPVTGPGQAQQRTATVKAETAAKAAPSAKRPPAANKAGAVSDDAKQFTQQVALAVAKLGGLVAANPSQADRVRKAVIDAANQGKDAKGREAARKALQLIMIELDGWQLAATSQAATAKAKADAEKAKPKERLYDVSVGGKQFRGATATEVCTALETVVDALEAELKRGFEAHCYELQIQQEEPFAAWVSGGITSLKATVSGDEEVDIMDLSIWDKPNEQLSRARAALRKQDVDAVVALVPKIKQGCRSAMGKVSKHNADSIESAETAIEGLTEVKEKSADFVKKGAETLGGKAAGVAVGALYTAAEEAAQQASAVHIAQTQKEIDWGAVAKEGAASAVSDIVGLLLEGQLAERFSGLFGPYLKEAKFGADELEAMGKAVGLTGPLARDALMTKTQKYVKDFLLEKAQSLITSAVADAIKGKKASDPPKPMDELMRDVVKGVATDKLFKMFAEFVIKRASK